MDRVKLGLWGTSRSGKTTFLTMLYHVFLTNSEQWEVFADEESRIFVEQAFEQIFSRRTFPEKTVSTQMYHYTIRAIQPIDTPEGRIDAGTTFDIEFLDAPGEAYENYYDRDRRDQHLDVQQQATQPKVSNRTPQEIFEYLMECNAILVLIDPARTENLTQQYRPYSQLLRQIFEDMRNERHNRQITAPLVAFCMTKVDGKTNLWESRHQKTLWIKGNQPESCPETRLVYDYLGEVFIKQLPGIIPIEKTHSFLISAIGRKAENNAEQVNVSTGYAWQRNLTPLPTTLSQINKGIVFPTELNEIPVEETLMPRSISDPDAIQPYNLLNPILWALVKHQEFANSSEE